jgi:hypothetical protein
MRIERGATGPYLFIPVYKHGQAQWDTTDVAVEVALILDDQRVPTEADWHDAVWEGTEARYLVNVADWADGEYMARVRLTAGMEQVAVPSARVTIG